MQADMGLMGEQKPKKSLEDMQAEEVQDYMSQGTYGVQKMYHDTGMPQKAEQYQSIQQDIQQQVYDGNARLFDIQDRTKLINATQMSKALADQIETLGSGDEGLKRVVGSLKAIGGPDLSQYDPDIQQQGLHLWAGTFQEQMANIASSPRGRELYGDVLEKTFNKSQNTHYQNMSRDMFNSSEEGKYGRTLLNAATGKKTHWDNPDMPMMSSGGSVETQVEEPNAPNYSMGEVQSLVGSIKAGIDPTADSTNRNVNDLYSKADIMDNILKAAGKPPIDRSSPAKLEAGLFSAAKAIDNNLRLNNKEQGSQEKDYGFVEQNRNDYRAEMLNAKAMTEDAQTLEEQQAGIQKYTEARKKLGEFNIANLDDVAAKEYSENKKLADTNIQMIQGQTQALAKVILTMKRMDPREIGASGGFFDNFKDYITEAGLGRAKDIDDEIGKGQASREQLDQALDEYILAVGQGPGGARLAKLLSGSINTMDYQSAAETFVRMSEQYKSAKKDQEAYDNYVRDKGTTNGAPKIGSSYADELAKQGDELVNKINKGVKIQAQEGDTLDDVNNTNPSLSSRPTEVATDDSMDIASQGIIKPGTTLTPAQREALLKQYGDQ